MTSEQKKQIKSDLILTAKNESFFEKKRAARFGGSTSPSITIQCYRTNDGVVSLPLAYASKLLGKPMNTELDHQVINIEFKGQLNDGQKVVIAEAEKHLDTLQATTFDLRPGYGKTVLGAYLACQRKLLTIVFTHREIISDQWRQTFEKFTNAKVYVLGEKEPKEYDVIVCLGNRYKSLSQEVINRIGMMIIDEAHCFCVPSYIEALLAFQPRYVIAESATLEREEDQMERVIYSICNDHKISRAYEGEYTVFKVITGTTPERKYVGGFQKNIDWNHLRRTTLFNNRRDEIAKAIIEENPTEGILILTALVDHAELLEKSIKTIEPSVGLMCGKRKTFNNCRVLVGTVSKIGTGFDQASACKDFDGRRFSIVILMCSFKKRSQLVQNVGRAFRVESPKVYHFVDDDSLYVNHWRICARWYRQTGASIKILDMTKWHNE